MKEQGIIIYQDGKYEIFGQHVCADQVNYSKLPSHEESFIKEVKESFLFKLSNLEYDKEKNLYQNAISLSQEGVVLIFNNQLSTQDETQILSYVPSNPTDEQINTLETSLKDKLKSIRIKQIAEFLSDDLDDYIMYDSFEEYVNEKNILGNNQK